MKKKCQGGEHKTVIKSGKLQKTEEKHGAARRNFKAEIELGVSMMDFSEPLLRVF